MAKQHNTVVFKAFLEFGRHLGEAMNNIPYLCVPEAIIQGGSISTAIQFCNNQMNETG